MRRDVFFCSMCLNTYPLPIHRIYQYGRRPLRDSNVIDTKVVLLLREAHRPTSPLVPPLLISPRALAAALIVAGSKSPMMTDLFACGVLRALFGVYLFVIGVVWVVSDARDFPNNNRHHHQRPSIIYSRIHQNRPRRKQRVAVAYISLKSRKSKRT